jgi:hypothetical protein
MIKSHWGAAALVCTAALIAAGPASAQTGGTSVPVPAGRPTEFKVLTSAATNPAEETLCQMLRSALRAVNGLRSTDPGLEVSVSLLPTIWSGQIDLWDKHNNNRGDQLDGNGDDKVKGHYGPVPVPEPSTLLSFGAALVVGAGVLFLQRLRRERK